MGKYRVQTVVSIIILIAVLSAAALPPVVSASAETINVTVTLPETLTVIGSDKSEAEQNLSSEVQLTVQPAIDALLIDRPEIAVWLDVTGTRFSFAYSIGSDGEGNCVINLSKLFLNIKSNPDVYDPDGMVSGIRQVISSFVPSGNTRYEILKSIHDFVCGLTVYDNDAAAGKETGSKFAHHAFGALIDGRAVCQGYSEAFKLICDANGIPCVLVSGLATSNNKTEEHMWCCVRMEDGKWYFIDATWDDGTKIKSDYFLVGNDTKISKKTFAGTHVPDGDLSNTGLKIFSYPGASSSKYSESGSAFSPETPDNEWFYNQLTANQKAIYDKIASVDPPVGNPRYVYTPPETTVTEKETETTAPPVTDPVVVSDESTEIHQVTTEESVTTKETSSATAPDTQTQITETDEITTESADGTTEIIASSDAGSETETDIPDTVLPQESVGDGITDNDNTADLSGTTAYDPGVSSDNKDSVTGEASRMTEGESDSEASSKHESERAAGSVSETATETDQTPESAAFDFKRILHVAVIVLAIIIAFSAITFVIVRIGKSDRNGKN